MFPARRHHRYTYADYVALEAVSVEWSSGRGINGHEGSRLWPFSSK